MTVSNPGAATTVTSILGKISMDPITGIGLAASVIQLVTFSIDAVKTCQEVYQQGSVSEYSNLDHTTSHLVTLTNSLQKFLQGSSTQSLALAREEKDLVNLARRCEDCANMLQKELRKLQARPRASALDAARKTARAIWKKSSITKIQGQLEAYQLTLETSLLSRLSQRFDTQALQSDRSFARLDKSLQHIITGLANSQTSLNTLVVQEIEQTRNCISAHIDRVERLHLDDRRYEDLTRSLFYPDIYSRQEMVDSDFDGIRNTYDWIFDEPQTHRMGSFDNGSPQKLVPQWDDFSRWLRSGHGMYWISGKAGSGKSTLMNYICYHRRTLALLAEWCSNRRLLTPAFFFWNAGTRLQKSIDGLLRSLAYQMLRECPELIGCLSNEPLHTWTQNRLSTTLLGLLKQSQIPVAICIFIDGLDEFEGREDIVIEMMETLANQTHVKVCLSSRPLLVFEEAFSGKPSLRLQDLTFDSIKEYAEFKLLKPIQRYISLNKTHRNQADYLLTNIVEKANGVFLWAIIVVRDVHDGLRGIANLNELAQTIESLPTQLESLFMLMLDRIMPAFKRDAAHFLGIVLYQFTGPYSDYGSMDLCRLHLSHSQRVLRDAPFPYDNVARNDLIAACRITEKRVQSHTAGLLELTPMEKGATLYQKQEDIDPVLFTNISFLHRTARDFLINNNEAKAFLAVNGAAEAQVRLSIARGTLAQLVHFSQGDTQPVEVDDMWYNSAYYPFLTILEQISIAERLLGAVQENLLQSLDYDTLASGYLPPDRPISFADLNYAFIISPRAQVSIDLVGMAAAVGMTLYICERLDLSIESRSYSPSLPDLNTYSRSIATAATLFWDRRDQSLKSDTSLANRLRSPDYRQALSECLQWSSRTAVSSDVDPLPETYILACCEPTCHDLVQILLQAGANPMVQVEHTEGGDYLSWSETFWDSWLKFLLRLRAQHMVAYGRPRALMLHHVHISYEEIFNTTKALLAQGADINYQVDDCSANEHDYLKRKRLGSGHARMQLTASAMFILEQCFDSNPEFREFATAIEPLVERPTRKIGYIHVCPYWFKSFEDYHINPCPTAEESEMLLALIEKWEITEHRNDLNALNAALERVWKSRNPGVELKGDDHVDYEDWSTQYS